MDEAPPPLHKLCYSSATRRISTCHRSLPWMTTLHILTRNPLAPPETITALLDVNVEVAFCFGNWEKIPLEYAKDYKIGGLIGMISGVCNPRYANNTYRVPGNYSTWKRRGTDSSWLFVAFEASSAFPNRLLVSPTSFGAFQIGVIIHFGVRKIQIYFG